MDDKEYQEKLREARNLLRDTLLQFNEELCSENESYWQGRKDATRLMYAIFGDRPDMVDLVESSPNSQKFDWEHAAELLEDAVYNVAAILWEIENNSKVDYRTKLNLENFLRAYTHFAKEGMFPIIDDHCLSDSIK